MRLGSNKCTWIISSYILIAGGLNCVANSPIPCETDAECNDGKSCTEDSCIDLFCRNTAIVCAEGQICVPASGVCEDGECAIHAHCDDRVFCNGVESCNFVSRTCGPGPLPCREDQVCEEVQGRCRDVECMADADCDDGDNCTTDSCNNNLACSNIELECPNGQVCIQLTGACVVSDCANDADCDDGLFCNGQEFCRLQARGCEPAPSAPCNEEGVRCNESLQRCENIRCVTSAECSQGQRCSISGACLSN